MFLFFLFCIFVWRFSFFCGFEDLLILSTFIKRYFWGVLGFLFTLGRLLWFCFCIRVFVYVFLKKFVLFLLCSTFFSWQKLPFIGCKQTEKSIHFVFQIPWRVFILSCPRIWRLYCFLRFHKRRPVCAGKWYLPPTQIESSSILLVSHRCIRI